MIALEVGHIIKVERKARIIDLINRDHQNPFPKKRHQNPVAPSLNRLRRTIKAKKGKKRNVGRVHWHLGKKFISFNRLRRHLEENTFAFCKEMKEIQDKLNKEMERFKETPENHPAYQDEWKKFWFNRFKELQAEGKIDPHSYDYKPEWIAFWNVRVKELFTLELENKRKELRVKYALPEADKEVRMRM